MAKQVETDDRNRVQTNGRKRAFKVVPGDVLDLKEALITALLSPLAVGKLKQRQVVHMLLPELRALRATGVEFDEISAILRNKGMRLTGDTLRSYYYEEKQENDDAEAEERVTQYLQMADRVMSQVADISSKGVQTVLNRALVEVAAVKAKRSPAAGGERPPDVHNGQGPDEKAPKLAPPRSSAGPQGSGMARGGDPTAVAMPGTPLATGAEGYMSLQDVERMLGEAVDLSKIPRRPRP